MKTWLGAFLFVTAMQTHAQFGEGVGVIKDSPMMNKEFNEQNMERILRGKNQISLTFDDGPTPEVTTKILDILQKYDVKATFFVIGEKVKQSPQIVERMVREGHLVGNHSMTHPNLADLGFFWRKKLSEEVLGSHELLVPYLSNNKRFYFRAPMGAWESKLSHYLNKDSIGQKYVGPLLWDVGGEMKRDETTVYKAADWACWAKGWSVDDCLQGYVNETNKFKGGVVLMHDLRSKSAELLEKYLAETKSKGYEFITLDEIDF